MKKCIALCAFLFLICMPTSIFANDDVLHNDDLVVECAASASSFSDVLYGKWYFKPINDAYDRGLVNGYNGTTQFKPENNVTRAEYVKMVAMSYAANYSAYQSPNYFSDVPSGHWARKYINWAYAVGIVNGTSSTTFSPDSYITRQDAAVISYRYSNYESFTLPQTVSSITFRDQNQISSYATTAVNRMQRAKILEGNPNKYFRPQNNITRAESAKITANLLQLIENSSQRAVYSKANSWAWNRGDYVVLAITNTKLTQKYRKISSERITFYQVDSYMDAPDLNSPELGRIEMYNMPYAPLKRGNDVIASRPMNSSFYPTYIVKNHYNSKAHRVPYKTTLRGTFTTGEHCSYAYIDLPYFVHPSVIIGN